MINPNDRIFEHPESIKEQRGFNKLYEKIKESLDDILMMSVGKEEPITRFEVDLICVDYPEFSKKLIYNHTLIRDKTTIKEDVRERD